MAYTIISQNNTTTTLSDENGNVITVPARVTLATSTDYTIIKVNNNSVDLESGDGKIIRGVPACVVLAGGGGGDTHNKGYFATLAELQEAYPTGEAGDWAIVAESDTVYIWDDTQQAWVDTDQKGQVTSVNGQTGEVSLSIPDAVQYSTMPTASVDNLGDIVQFTGTTDANYTNGYFYKCISDGQDPATYSWEAVEVQASASGYLPLSGGTMTGDIEFKYDTTKNGYGLGVGSDLGFNALYLGYYNNGVFTKNIRLGSTASSHIYPMNSGLITLGGSTKRWANVYTLKINNGADITVPVVAGSMAVQVSTLPTAASTNVGEIYQYIGATDSTYTNGHFYKCVSDGADPATYSWTEVQLGGGSSYTAGTGIDITNDVISVTAPTLQNTATGINSLTVAGNTHTWNQTMNIGGGTSVGGFNVSGTTTIGSQATGYGSNSTNVGAFSKTGFNQATAYGASSEANALASVALGYLAKATAQGAIQINASSSSATNSDTNTFKVGNANGNFELMDANGNLPADRLASTTGLADGNYRLRLVMASGVPTLSWVAE